MLQDFPKAVGEQDLCPLCTKRWPIPILKRAVGNPINSGLSATIDKIVVH